MKIPYSDYKYHGSSPEHTIRLQRKALSSNLNFLKCFISVLTFYLPLIKKNYLTDVISDSSEVSYEIL